MSYELAVDSSTFHGSLAIAKDGQILFQEQCLHQRSHSEFFNASLERGLKQLGIHPRQLDTIYYDKGPGSFTGLRVTGNLVKTLSFLHQTPVVAVDSLHVLAAPFLLQKQDVLVVMNAFKNLFFSCAYQADKQVLQPSSVSAEQLHQLLNNASGPLALVGDAVDLFLSTCSESQKKLFLLSENHVHTPLAQTLIQWGNFFKKHYGTLDWNFIQPLYLRDSEAEENLRKKSNLI